MTEYEKYEVQLSNDQIRKIKRGIKENEAVSIRLQPTNQVKTYLMLTQNRHKPTIKNFSNQAYQRHN